MANKDLFKQAIAEAKSVREAAIANAKEALEETLTPHLKDMLAAKLQEQEDKEDAMEEMKHDDEMDEVLDIAEEEAEDDSMELDDEAEEEAEMDDMEADLDSEDGLEGDEELGDLSVDEFKDMIRDIIAQELGGAEAEMDDMDAGDIEGMGDEEPMEDPMMDEPEGDEEEIDLDELLAELDHNSDEGMEKDHDMDEKKHHDMDEEVVSEDIDPSVLAAISSLLVPAGAAGLAKLMDYLKAKHPKVAQGLEKLGGSAMGRDVSDMQDELYEATRTVKHLQRDLQEVNLLNSKLLYVNKIFKANNLSESQKVNVISAFDKAETVKEVKLVFETVSENVVPNKKGNFTESRIKGMASKATGITASKPEVINEASEAVRRMQVLAGIIK